MKSLTEIVDFYDALESRDLFSESAFSMDEFQKTEEFINKKNKEFYEFIENLLVLNKFSYKSLQITFERLSDIYRQCKHRLESYHIPNIENTPIFRYKH